MKAQIPPSETDTSRTKIYRSVRRSIILGYLHPGERFDVDDLAGHYQTSVTPVRDALQMLSQEGLVTIKPRSGYFVTQITLKELRDMLELRKILEIAAIERAVLRVTPEQILALRAVHAGYTGDDDLSYDRYTDENRQFHFFVARISGNQELADMLGRLLDRLARFMVMRHGGKSQEISHARIVDAMEAHMMEEARRALLEDIESSQDAIMDGVLEDGAGNWMLGSTLTGSKRVY